MYERAWCLPDVLQIFRRSGVLHIPINSLCCFTDLCCCTDPCSPKPYNNQFVGVVKAKFNQSLWLIPSLGFWTQEQLLTAHSSPTLPINSGHSLFPQACSLQVFPPTPLFFWQVVLLSFQVFFSPWPCIRSFRSARVSAVLPKLLYFDCIIKYKRQGCACLMEKPSRNDLYSYWSSSSPALERYFKSKNQQNKNWGVYLQVCLTTVPSRYLLIWGGDPLFFEEMNFTGNLLQ